MHRLHCLAICSALTLAPLAQAAADTSQCAPSRVLVLFDRSTSMIKGKIDDVTKWDLATDALEDAVSQYESKAEFGLSIFPATEGTCKTGGKVVVEPQLMARLPINVGLSSLPPGTNSWTPIGQTVAQVINLPSMADDGKRRRFVILVTDGAQSCPQGKNGNPDETSEIWGHSKIVAQVTALRNDGIKTFVVGFGEQTMGSGDDGVDALLLNKMAEAGGTKRTTSCNATGNDPAATNNCYYAAGSGDELLSALEAISVQISNEVCDGEDNNCNLQIDEGFDVGGTCQVGIGACKATGVKACSADGTGTVCSAVPGTPGAEVCDETKDENCDGRPDNNCTCQSSDPPQECGLGECKGHQRCVNHEWGECDGKAPTNENECDGKDHNCDGVLDNKACECVPGTTQSCGPKAVPNSPCHPGTVTCDATGHWPKGESACVGAGYPMPETCDSIDNNCDGSPDNPQTAEGDDVPHGLCRVDEVCDNGHCVLVPPVVKPPPVGNMSNGEASGCACTVGSSSGSGAAAGNLLLAGFVGLVLFFRGRRRR